MTPTRRLFFALALSATAALMQTTAQAAAPQTLKIDLASEPSSLDPQLNWNPDSYDVYRNIFDNLVTRDDAGKIAPQIATSWKQDTPTEITFTIRDGVKFQDGSPLTAEDVAFSIQRITDPKFKSPQLSQFAAIKSAEAVDKTHVKVTLDQPYPALLAQLVKLSIVPKAVVEKEGNAKFNEHPVGSGPYAFESWQRGVSVALKRNDEYWGRKPVFPQVVFRAVPDPSTRVADLQSGAADLVVSLNPDLAMQIKSNPTVEPRFIQTERVAYLRVNPQNPATSDLKIRQAIAYSIDREAIVQGLLGGYAKADSEMLTPAHVGYTPDFKGIGYDPDKAKALVKELGPAAQKDLVFLTAPVFDQRVVQALQQMIQDVGLHVKIEMTDLSNYLQRVQSDPKTAPPLGFGRWSCACQDADGVLYPLLHSGSSWSATDDPAVDKLLDDARVELDPKKRDADYAKVNAYIAKEIPMVPLYQDAAIYGVNKKLKWQPTPNESLFVDRMAWSD